MSRGRCTFRQGDMTKAVKAVAAAGVVVARVEVDRDGKIIVIAKGAEPAQDSAGNPWDGAMRELSR